MSWLHVTDAADAFRAATHAPASALARGYVNTIRRDASHAPVE